MGLGMCRIWHCSAKKPHSPPKLLILEPFVSMPLTNNGHTPSTMEEKLYRLRSSWINHGKHDSFSRNGCVCVLGNLRQMTVQCRRLLFEKSSFITTISKIFLLPLLLH